MKQDSPAGCKTGKVGDALPSTALLQCYNIETREPARIGLSQSRTDQPVQRGNVMNSRRVLVSGMDSSSAVDVYAACVAFLCLLHCLALPVLAASVSAAVPFAENELVHKVLVLIAVPASLYVVFSGSASGQSRLVKPAVIIGLALLIAAAFVPALESHERWLTVLGSVLLAAAHLWRALKIRAARRRSLREMDTHSVVG